MSPSLPLRLLDAAFVTALPIAIGLASDFAAIPWVALVSIPILLLVPKLRHTLRTHEFLVVASAVTATSIAALTPLRDPTAWTSSWFLSLLGTVGISNMVCLATGVRNKRGMEALAFVLVHVALPLILVGGGMKALWKIEGMLPLHEGESSRTLLLTDGGQPTGKTLELPFQVRLDRFRVEFYPKRLAMHLFDPRAPEVSLGQLDMSPGATLEAAGVLLEASGIEQQTRQPSDAHQGMELTFATLTVDGRPFEFPLAAAKDNQSMPFPWGDRAILAELVQASAVSSKGATAAKVSNVDPTELPPGYGSLLLVFSPAAEGPFDPSTCSVSVFRQPEGTAPLLKLSLKEKTQGQVTGTSFMLAVTGVKRGPMEPTPESTKPVTISMALFSIDGESIVFPVSVAREDGDLDLPVGDSASLAELVRASRSYFSLPEQDVPPIYEHIMALFQVVEEPRLFQSRLTLVGTDGATLDSQEVLVNEPLRYDGWWFYQADWDPDEPGFSGIQAVQDPGLWVAFAGLFLLAVGAVMHVRRMVAGPAKSGGAA